MTAARTYAGLAFGFTIWGTLAFPLYGGWAGLGCLTVAASLAVAARWEANNERRARQLARIVERPVRLALYAEAAEKEHRATREEWQIAALRVHTDPASPNVAVLRSVK